MNNRKLISFLSCFSLFLTFLIAGCHKVDPVITEPKLVTEYSGESALKWNKLFLEIERYATGYRPGPAPRALGYLGLASYEACITGMPEYNSLEDHFPGLNIPDIHSDEEYHWPTVVHAVYTTMMPKFFTEEPPVEVRKHWNELVSELNAKYLDEAGEVVFNRSIAYGESVGNAVWEWSSTDPYGHNAYLNPFGESYDWTAHYDGPGDWVPTPPEASPVGPFFGKARTFAIQESEKLSMPPANYQVQYSEDIHSEYYHEAVEIYSKNADNDYYVGWIGEFWSDDFLNLTFSFGPRWVSIANQIVEKDNVPLDKAIEAYAKTGMALNDAAVACWNSKFLYNTERPITYIKKFIDPNYTSSLRNPLTGEHYVPPYQAYPSGHATMGSAGAEVLASVFGYSYAMTDNSHLGRTEFKSGPRTFPSLHEMALENAWSRIVLGTNWPVDCIEGNRFGTEIGQKVVGLPWKK